MNSRIFKATLGQDYMEKGATYKPGEQSYDLKLVNEIVERCEYLTLGAHDGTVAFITNAVPKQMEYLEHFDQDAFLEALVLGWQQNEDYDTLDFALTKSVEALHGAGIGNFTINLRAVPERLYKGFSSLRGSEEHPLTITCLGEVEHVGSGVEHCNLEVVDYVESFGHGARFSEFRFTGSRDVPVLPGWGAEDSAYYIPRMEGMPFTRSKEYLMFRMKIFDYSGFLPTSLRCRFYVEEVRPELLKAMEGKGFWQKENRLYVPNEKGGWKEVTP